MNKFNNLWVCLIAVMVTLSSCEVIGDIFKAGMWVGIILVVAIILLILWIVRKVGR